MKYYADDLKHSVDHLKYYADDLKYSVDHLKYYADDLKYSEDHLEHSVGHSDIKNGVQTTKRQVFRAFFPATSPCKAMCSG